MDTDVVEQIKEKNLQLDLDRLTPRIAVSGGDRYGKPIKPGDPVFLIDPRDRVARVQMKQIPDLFPEGNKACVIGQQIPDEYIPLFACVERTALEYCLVTDRKPTDDEFKSFFQYLIRLPDGEHSDPIVSYLQAGFRLYMSVRKVTRNEYETVLERMQKSVRNFRLGNDSTVYIEYIAHQFDMGPDPTKEIRELAGVSHR